MRRIPVPPHRYAPLKEKWLSIYTPVVEQLHLQMRFELKSRNVEIKVRFKLNFGHNTYGDQCDVFFYQESVIICYVVEWCNIVGIRVGTSAGRRLQNDFRDNPQRNVSHKVLDAV